METRNEGPRKALGRGLAALIPTVVAPAPGLRTLPIERIRPSRQQPRKRFAPESLAELAASIQARGVLQPIVVRRAGEDYELVAGERRWRAAAQAGLRDIPAIVKELSDSDALQVALIENVQREDLDPLEEAAAYLRLIDEHGMTQEQVAEAVQKSRPAVANSLRLLKLPKAIVDLLAAGSLTAGHARALMTLSSERHMLSLAERIVARHLSVRDAEREARRLGKAARPTASRRTPSVTEAETRLQRHLGTRVALRYRRGKGRIEIYFHTLDQLDGLLDRLLR